MKRLVVALAVLAAAGFLLTSGPDAQVRTTAAKPPPQDPCALVDAENGPATVRALRDAGFGVQVKVITFLARGTDARDAAGAPAGTFVVGVLDARGEHVDPGERDLVVEVSARGGHGHHGQAHGVCGASIEPLEGERPPPPPGERPPGGQPGDRLAPPSRATPSRA